MSGSVCKLEAGTWLMVDTSNRRLHHYQGKNVVQVYLVAVGKPSTPTPAGHYQVVNKVVNPGGVLGTRWMGLNIPGGNYGIHGTNNPDSIGKAVSNGCIRMYNHDVESIFPKVSIGTPVIIEAGSNASSTSIAPGKWLNYTVKPGDTLWKIARRFGVELDALIQANSLPNPDEIIPGQRITIPLAKY